MTASRRTFLGLLGASAAAPALASCRGSDAKVSSRRARLEPFPAYVPFQGPEPDLPGDANGIQPGYLNYPRRPGQSVEDPPGNGETLTALVVSYMPPPTPLARNRFWQAVNKALGVNLNLIIVPSANFKDKVATMMAGNQLPDMMLVNDGGFHVTRESEFILRSCADLSRYLAGDAVRDYPNLANIPTYSWQSVGRISGRLYGVPIERAIAGGCLPINRTALERGAKVPVDWTKDEFVQVMRRFTDARHWGLGASFESTFGDGYHACAHGAANTWIADGGAFRTAYDTDEYRAALNFMQRMNRDGIYYPDALSSSAANTAGLFYAGTLASLAGGYSFLNTAINTVKRDFVVDLASPYRAVDKPRAWLGRGSFGYTVLKKADPKRVKLILRVLNFLAAPFGSTEYELTHFGVEGVHFTRESDGSITRTPLADQENPDVIPIRYVADAPGVCFYPGRPDATRLAHAYQARTVPTGIKDPTVGLKSDVQDRYGAIVNKIIASGITDIVSGRKPVSAWDDVIGDWKSQGGERIAADYSKELEHLKSHD